MMNVDNVGFSTTVTERLCVYYLSVWQFTYMFGGM